MNQKLGGSFSGNVNLVLREEKGFTYGARTGFSGSYIPGTFIASSSVRSSATLESVEIFKRLMEAIGRTDLANDPALAHNEGRVARVEEIDAAIAAWTSDRGIEEILTTMTRLARPACSCADGVERCIPRLAIAVTRAPRPTASPNC